MPLAEVSQNEQCGVHQVQVGESAIEIVKSRAWRGFAVSVP